MNSTSFVVTRDENGDLFALNTAHIKTISYDADELIIELTEQESITYEGDEALELLEQLLPGALAADNNRDTEGVTDSGSARPLAADAERAELVRLLDDIERLEGMCRFLMRVHRGDLSAAPEIANLFMTCHAKIIEHVETANDVLAAFEDRAAANDQDETDQSGDEVAHMRALHAETLDCAARILDEFPYLNSGDEVIAHLLIGQADALYQDYENDFNNARRGTRPDALKALDRAAYIGIANEAGIKINRAIRAYFAGDFVKACDDARAALSIMRDVYEPGSAPHTQALRALEQRGRRANGKDRNPPSVPAPQPDSDSPARPLAADAADPSDAANRDAALVTDKGHDGGAGAVSVAPAATDDDQRQQPEGESDGHRG